jgi:hypothetical protein
MKPCNCFVAHLGSADLNLTERLHHGQSVQPQVRRLRTEDVQVLEICEARETGQSGVGAHVRVNAKFRQAGQAGEAGKTGVGIRSAATNVELL